MAKRKRVQEDLDSKQKDSQKRRSSPTNAQSKKSASTPASQTKPSKPVNVQIITGSYDRVLHGIVATIPEDVVAEAKDLSSESVVFNDNFLFTAHASAIRCLAVSPVSTKNPSESKKVILASGGTDERINLYSVSTSVPPTLKAKVQRAKLNKVKLEKPRNKELGALLHHSSNVNVLHFPSRSKLLSGADDNTVAVSRTRDWTVLSTIKAPVPRAAGRPSGDTAPPGETPAGLNDLAVHPSMKLMITVGKGEKCMRLWNLVTGRKAGVLNFERNLLQAVKETKFSSGEGRKVVWNGAGDEFVVGFDRGAIVFAMDSKPKGRIVPSPVSKLHQIRFFTVNNGQGEFFATSTEDGRILFYALGDSPVNAEGKDDEVSIPSYTPTATLGGRKAGVSGRIKDFEILPLPGTTASILVVTAGSEGSIKLWTVQASELTTGDSQTTATEPKATSEKTVEASPNGSPEQAVVGKLIGTSTSENRITCLKAFLLTNTEDEAADADDGVERGSSESEFEGLD